MNLSGRSNPTTVNKPTVQAKVEQVKTKNIAENDTTPVEQKEIIAQVDTVEEVVSEGIDYKNAVVDLLSTWTADLMKDKNFDAAKKLIDIATSITDI